MTQPPAATPPLYAGLAGMAAVDPDELALQVFLRVFSPSGTHFDVNLVHGVLQDLSGLRESSGRDVRAVFAMASTYEPLDPFYLQCMVVWERSLIAARLTRGRDQTWSYLVLLPQGWQALASANPPEAIRALIARR